MNKSPMRHFIGAIFLSILIVLISLNFWLKKIYTQQVELTMAIQSYNAVHK